MRKIKFLFLLFWGILAMPGITVAQSSSDEVTLVVSADGATKEAATNMALRSAVEQAFGAFVSSNTTVLNDELVKDEIATISSGNVTDFRETACEQMPDGRFYVTLRATVSVTKLASYVQNKGLVSTSFEGAQLAANYAFKEMNMKLNKENEEKVLNHLNKVINDVYPLTFDYEMVQGEPRFGEATIGDLTNSRIVADMKYSTMEYFEIPFTVKIVFNESAKNLDNYIHETLNSIKMTQGEINEYWERYRKSGVMLSSVSNDVCMPLWCDILYEDAGKTNNTSTVTKDRRKQWEDFLGVPLHKANKTKEKSTKKKDKKGADSSQQGKAHFTKSTVNLRTSFKLSESSFSQARKSFNIVDNNGDVVAYGAEIEPEKDNPTTFKFPIRIHKDVIANYSGFELIRTNNR